MKKKKKTPRSILKNRSFSFSERNKDQSSLRFQLTSTDVDTFDSATFDQDVPPNMVKPKPNRRSEGKKDNNERPPATFLERGAHGGGGEVANQKKQKKRR